MEFLNWHFLTEYAGALMAVMLITQLIKNIWVLKKLPVQMVSYSRREPNPDRFLTGAFPPDCVIGGNHTPVCSPPLPCRTKKRLDKNCMHRSVKNF